MAVPCSIPIKNEQDIVLARQVGRNLAKELGYGNIEQSRVATAISELARNIFLYAGEGSIVLEHIQKEGRVGLRITANDQGPGITDLRKAMEHGYSTSGGLGAGLPGVKRMMDEFAIDSMPGKGTEVVVTKWRS
ncbi:anti-sigma regulatory factor [Brevibacillus dissolubilis]|uniref:anti-sigma regulatory factor n=1 Tax=Brevibacillus dissolubilis TaxID=1844116 RepID=UPI001116EED5|nr:anti-sigma regulatory factor [Brevibacillus dissolubilis]